MGADRDHGQVKTAHYHVIINTRGCTTLKKAEDLILECFFGRDDDDGPGRCGSAPLDDAHVARLDREL